jgi:copper chaperone NosL
MITFNKIYILLLITFAFGCSSPAPTPINYGHDACDYCKMTIVDKKFGTELVTTKGKVFKFDSIECLAAFTLKGDVADEDVFGLYVSDFNNPLNLVSSKDVYFIHSKELKSPMSFGLVAVKDSSTAINVRDASYGELVSWDQLRNLVKNDWNIK